MTRPRPPLPPVMSATRPFNENSSSITSASSFLRPGDALARRGRQSAPRTRIAVAKPVVLSLTLFRQYQAWRQITQWAGLGRFNHAVLAGINLVNIRVGGADMVLDKPHRPLFVAVFQSVQDLSMAADDDAVAKIGIGQVARQQEQVDL